MHPAARSMIEVAERLVAERGLATFTVQAVQREAGQRNKAAVQYHFGDRQGLIAALLAERIAPAEARRTSMLAALDDDASTRDLVEVLVRPLIESVLSRRPSYWARFLLQALGDPTISLAALAGVDSVALQATQTRLEEQLDHLPPATRALRVQSAAGYAVVVLAAFEVGALPHQGGEPLATEIIDACHGLVSAPSTVAARRCCIEEARDLARWSREAG